MTKPLTRAEQERMASLYEQALTGDQDALEQAREIAARIQQSPSPAMTDRERLERSRRRTGSAVGTGRGRKDEWLYWEERLAADDRYSNQEVAARTGRSLKAVWLKRQRMRIPQP